VGFLAKFFKDSYLQKKDELITMMIEAALRRKTID